MNACARRAMELAAEFVVCSVVVLGLGRKAGILWHVFTLVSQHSPGRYIVESFGLDDSTLTVSEIARRSELHIATASRLIEGLVGCGWLERENRQVRIGVRLWEVASRASAAAGLREAAMPFMEDLHAVVGQHTQLAVLEGDEVLFIERSPIPGRRSTTPGSRGGCRCTRRPPAWSCSPTGRLICRNGCWASR